MFLSESNIYSLVYSHDRFEVVTKYLTVHFKVVQSLCSREDFPLSVYIVLVQALRNELNRGLNFNNCEFNRVLGDGAAKEVADMIRERFNMDGLDISGRKVGLLDRHHLWCYLVDPFNHQWRSTFYVDAPTAVLVNEMINAYVPVDDDGSSETRKRVKEEFMVKVFLMQL